MEEKQTSNKAIAKKRLSGRAVILIVCIAAVVLLAAGAAVLIFVWGRDSASGAAENNPSGAALVQENQKWQDYTYSVYDDGTATLTGYTGKDTLVKVPAEVNGHPVTTIGLGCFNQADDPTMEEIMLPESVTHFEPHAFGNAKKLKSITDRKSVV